jgi:lipopolysaccharide transport system ATP-binding protein
MSSIAIKVENISKKYIIYHAKESISVRNITFRDVLAENAKNIWKKICSPFSYQMTTDAVSKSREDFWALKNISFELHQGDRLGIIGRNGAGKTTLLKILSRITEANKGKIYIKGRVGSLLEVGTGFHPELTGRENIFLNGAVLGMSKPDIKNRFDEIVAFAEVEKFLDTPVKRYSSGMYVRLAFAVAAHLEPEILVVDEVLAVGDIQFQKKCLRKMEDAASDGRTVLMVSHNMATILSLSSKCMLLSEGNLIKYGQTQEVIKTYQDGFTNQARGQTDLSGAEYYGNGKARFLSIFMKARNQSGKIISFPVTGCDIEFEVVIRAFAVIKSTTVGLTIYDEIGNRLIDVNSLIKGESLSLSQNQEISVKFLLNNVRLKPDVYTVGLWLGILNVEDICGIRYASSFRVEARREDILYTTPFPGVYACEFEYEQIPE